MILLAILEDDEEVLRKLGLIKLAMNTAREDLGYDEMALSGSLTWQVFCENSAKFAAIEFGVQCRTFIFENPISTQGIIISEFGKKFVEYFIKHFNALTTSRFKTEERSENGNVNADVSTLSRTTPRLKSVGRPNTVDLSSTFASSEASCLVETRQKEETTNNEITKKDKGKGMFKHLSFKVLRKSTAGRTIRNLFRQSSSEDSSTAEANTNMATQSKGKIKSKADKSSKPHLEKEGILNLLTTPEDFDSSPQWERCRVQLLRQNDSNILEVFVPPKVNTDFLLFVDV